MPSSLDIYAEVTTADGRRYRWDANQAPGSRPQNLSWRTKIGEGFSDASLQLARRIDLDYPDLNLGDTVTLCAADGTVVYEGFVAAMPRDLSDSHSIGVTLAGWMAHAKDKKFTEIYVDRGLGDWGGMSVQRRANLLALSFSPTDAAQGADPSSNQAGLITQVGDAWASPYMPTSEAWYDAGPGNTIGRLTYSWARQGGINNTDVNWNWNAILSTNDVHSGTQSSGNLRAAGPVANATLAANATSYRHATLQLFYNSTPAGTAGAVFSLLWFKPAVYGNHGLTLRTGETGEPDGVYASDVMKNIAQRWCPQLDTSGIVQTDYVIQHLAFKDRTFPYDAFLEINKYHLWHLGVWENKRLDFRPYDLTDYDWEIRTDDPGTTFSPQGPSTDSLFNGIAVTYTDLVTGIVNVLTPDTNPELADSSTENPWTEHGRDHWDEITLSTPTLEDQATQLGVAALADRNRPKTPGTITIKGYVRDRAGNEQSVSKVRAGDTIAITNFNDAIRLIVETDMDDENKQIRLAIDKPFALLEAVIDRQANALQARGLA